MGVGVAEIKVEATGRGGGDDFSRLIIWRQ